MLCAQAARHTHSMRSRLADLVDLLLGWSLEPDLPHSTRSSLHERAHALLLYFAVLKQGSSGFADTLSLFRALLMRRAPCDQELYNFHKYYLVAHAY